MDGPSRTLCAHPRVREVLDHVNCSQHVLAVSGAQLLPEKPQPTKKNFGSPNQASWVGSADSSRNTMPIFFSKPRINVVN